MSGGSVTAGRTVKRRPGLGPGATPRARVCRLREVGTKKKKNFNMCGDLGIQVYKKDKVEISFLIAYCLARSDESQNGDEE